MRATPSRPGAAVTLLAVAAAVLWPHLAHADTALNQPLDARGFKAYNFRTPVTPTEPVRLQDVAVCAGIPWSIGVNGAFRCSVDGTDFLSPTTGIAAAGHAANSIIGRAAGSSGAAADISCPTPGTFLGNVSGTLACAAAAGVFTPDAPLAFSGSHLQLALDGVTVGVSAGAVQRLALTFTGAFTGTMAAGSGSLATAFGLQSGDSLFGVPGSSTAVPAPIVATADNQVYQRLAGTVQAHTLDYSQLTGTPAAVTSVTGVVVGSGPGATATTFGLAGAHTVLGVAGGSMAAPAFIGPATAGQVFMADPSTTALGWEIPPLVTTSLPGYMSAADKIKINGGVTPTVVTDLLRYGDLQSCVGVIQWTGSALGCASTLGFVDPFAVVGGNLTLKIDSTLQIRGGQLSVVSSPSTTLAAGAVGFGSSSNLLTGDATNFHWDGTNKRLGLREATPAWQLDLVDETGAGDRGMTLGSYFASTTGMAVRLEKSRGSFASPTAVASGDYTGRFEMMPYDGANYLPTAVFGSRITGAVSAGSVRTLAYLAAANGGVSNDPFGSNQVGLYLSSQASTAPTVTVPSLNLAGSNALVVSQSGVGTLFDSNLLTFNSNTLTVGPSGPGPTAGTAPVYINGGGAALPDVLLFNAQPNYSGSIAFYAPFNSAGTIGVLSWVGPGSTEATTFGVSNAFVFNAAVNSNTGGEDEGPVVFRAVTAVGGTYFNGFSVDGYGSTTWANSSAPICPSGAGSIRTHAGTLQYCENAGAWTSFDTLGGGITSLSGDGTATGPGAATLTLAANVVSNAKFRQSGALSLVGRSANSAGNAADISATAASGAVLRESGSTIGFGSITEGAVTSLTTDLAGKQATGNYIVGLASAVTATGPGTPTATVHLDAGSTVQGLLPLGNLVNCATGQIVGMIGGVEGCVTPAVGTVYTGTSPVVVSGSVVSCPTCTTASGFTNGSAIFWNGGLAQDNAGFFYDSTNHRLGLGNTTPSYQLDITQTLNGTTAARVTNLSGGTSAAAQFTASNNAGALAYAGITGTGYTAYGPINGGRAYFGSTAGPAVFLTQSADPLIFYTNGAEAGRWLSGGGLKVGSLTSAMTKAVAGVLTDAVAGADYQAPGNYIAALTGDGTASGPGSATFTLASTGVAANTYGGAGKYIQSVQVDAKGRLVANPVVVSGAQAVVWKFFSRGEFLNYDPTNKSDAFAMADGDSIRWAGTGGSIIALAVLNSETANSAPYYTNNVTPDANGTFQAYLGYANGVGSGSASLKVDLLAIHGSPGNSSNYTDLATCTISPTQAAGDNIGACSSSISTSFSAGDLFVVIVSRADTNPSLSLNNISLAATVWIPQ